MAQILQGRVFEKNMNDFYQGIQANQNQQQINEAKKQNQMKAMEKYFADLALSNDLGAYGVLLDHGDTVKQYLGMAGVKDIEGEYQNALKQGLTPDIERKLWMRSQMGNVGEGGGGSQVSPEPTPQTPSAPQNIPNPTLNLAPAEQGFQQKVVQQKNPIEVAKEGFTQLTPEQLKQLKLLREEAGGIPSKGMAAKTSTMNNMYGETTFKGEGYAKVVKQDIGKIQNGRFIPTAYTPKADKNAIVTSMLVSSGYRADAIEEKDIRDYENFLVNANGLKSRDELWSGKGFKVPPRVIGQNEIDIISKLTPELQKQYATLVEQKEKALKAGNNGGAAKAQEQMNQIASKGGTPRSPYTLSDAQYNRFGVIFGVGTKEEVDATLMQLAKMDSGSMTAALDQAKINNETKDAVYKAAAAAQANANTRLINQQIANSGLSEKDQLELREQAYKERNERLKNFQLETETEAYTKKLMAESQDKVVTLFKDLANKQKVKPNKIEGWLMNLIESGDSTVDLFKQNYRADAQFHNYYLEPAEGESIDSPSFRQRVQAASIEFEKDLNEHTFNKLAPAFGIVQPSGKLRIGTAITEGVAGNVQDAFDLSTPNKAQASGRQRESKKSVEKGSREKSNPSALGMSIAEEYKK